MRRLRFACHGHHLDAAEARLLQPSVQVRLAEAEPAIRVKFARFLELMLQQIQHNDAPTLAPLANLLMLENGPSQLAPFIGVTTGVTNEFDTLSVTATSSDPSLVPHPAATYSSPSPTGTLTVVPAANQSGTVTITVTVDDGGTTHQLASRQFTVRVLSAAEQPVIRLIARVGEGVEVTFPTVSGMVYTLEYTDVLPAGSWNPLAPVAGTGGDVTLTDPVVVGPRFYRLSVRTE